MVRQVVRPGERRCPQCWQPRPEEDFLSAGKSAQCAGCRKVYGGGRGRRSPEERRARLGGSRGPLPRVLLMKRSGADKLGGIPATISSAETCPESCALRGKGCFGEFHILSVHWRRAGEQGAAWHELIDWVRQLPGGTVWRHNIVGDLPGEGDRLDPLALLELAAAAVGTRGFTFTHKPLRTRAEELAVRAANRAGFTVNLSANSLAEADRLLARDLGPVAAIVPPETRTGDRTPGGRRVTVCPAMTKAKLTCRQCELCSRADRKAVVGFYPHGQLQRAVRRLTVLA